MESENFPDPYEDNRIAVSRQSVHSIKNDSQSIKNYKLKDEEEKREIDSRSKTRIYHSDPDRDKISDEESRRSKKSYYSDDYDSQSERSLSTYSRSRSPSPTPQTKQTKRVSSSPPYKTGGVGRKGAPRPQRGGRQYASQQFRRGACSQSKEPSPSKDLDLVTKRMLSGRLLKINELRNALAELQQHTNELQKENRILRQLQLRQEKALHRYDDTESEISQLISRHSNEIHVLRERLRRTQERERTVERRLKESEEQLIRSQATVTRLKKLVDQRDLGPRDELTRKLDEEKGLRQEAERRIKELERSMELSTSSFQRQLVSEKKKTVNAQEEVRTLQEELERLTNKLKEKDRELHVKNIYANHMLKVSQVKDAESGTKRKFSSRMSTVAVQTEDRQELSSLGFPTPPPALTDAIEYDEYLSLKEPNKDLESQHKQSNKGQTDKVLQQEKAQDQELNYKQQRLNHESTLHDKTEKTLKEAKEQKELNGDVTSSIDQKKSPRPSQVQEEIQRLNQETNQQAAEEARRKKEHLLAKMREIDQLNQAANDHIFNEPNLTNHSEQKSPSASVFSLTQPDNVSNTGRESREATRRRTERESSGFTTGLGRRTFRTQTSSDDLAFGSYAPSFGNTSSRGTSNFPPTPPKEDKGAALETIGVFSFKKTDVDKEKDVGVRGETDKKSSLMQQLFGNIATTDHTADLLGGPPVTNGVRSRRGGHHGLDSGSHARPTASKSTIHIAETKPAVVAINSLDDDIEELTL
ncbi:lebercilin [Eucyclogobius newberryi]|uniref:lebercilin n=1 Tax=Eucyclogobius newberryi TaxID=166745 RepID=UPI003B5BA2C5